MRNSTRFIATLSGGALLAVLASLSVATTGASFTASAVSPGVHSAQTASLDPLANVVAQRNADGTVGVSWTPPAVRDDVDPEYRVERSVGGSTAVIDPDISSGAGFVDDPAVPAVLAGKKVTAVDVGSRHSCALAEGAVYCWGSRANGKLGNGAGSGTSAAPVRVGGSLEGKAVTEISVGSEHTCALAEGTVYCWGRNAHGQLGDGSTTNSGTPKAVGGVLAEGTVTSIGAGLQHTCAVMDGWPYCWGARSALGIGDLGFGSEPVTLPTAVTAKANALDTGDPDGVLVGKTATSVTSGSDYSCVVTTEGAGICWGYHGDGRGGSGSGGGGGTSSNYPSPILPTEHRGPQLVLDSIVAGNSHTCGITREERHLYCWGNGINGQTGRGDTFMVTYPRPVLGALEGRAVTSVRPGFAHTCAVADEELYCWGLQQYGAVGNGETSGNATLPVRISGGTIGDAPATDGVSSRYHGCGVADDSLHCWGWANDGVLGTGQANNEVHPFPVAVKTDGALAGAPTCQPGWLLGEDERCRPAPETPVSYRIGYSKAGWSPPAPVEVVAVWGSD